jgi:hypothetical protein
MTIKDTRELFDLILNGNSGRLLGHSTEFECRLKSTHCLVVSPDSEEGVYKIMSGKSEELSPSEREACVSLLKTNWDHLFPRVAVVEEQQQEDSPMRFFMKRMKEKGTSESHKKKPRSNNASIYISDLSWIQGLLTVRMDGRWDFVQPCMRNILTRHFVL